MLGNWQFSDDWSRNNEDKWIIEQLKDDYLYLLNDVKHIIQDRPNGNFVDSDNNRGEIVDIVDKQIYEQAFSECKKFRSLIKTVVESNTKALSEQEYDYLRDKYRKIINDSEISNGYDAVAGVWNEHNPGQVPDTKCGKYKTVFLQMMISNWLYQTIFLRIRKRTFRNTNVHIM